MKILGWSFTKRKLTDILSKIDSVAVVGASPKPGKVGNTVLQNIIAFGFKGKIYPVNPKYEEILGLRTYPSLKDVPDVPDVVVIAVPTKAVPQVLAEASRIGIGLAVIITSGFKEAGNEEAERELREVLKSMPRTRVLGPNSAGITVSTAKLHASIEAPPTLGRVGLAMQSGAMGGVVISRLKELSSGISFFMSLGNMVDVEISDVFDYALEDGETESLIAYVEWVRDGKAFLEKGSKLTAIKPLCILKGGRGERSSEAVRSHTGGLAGNYTIFREAVRKIGAYLADDVSDLVEVEEVLRRVGHLNGTRVLIVTNSGGLGVVTASHVEEHGLDLPTIPPKLAESLIKQARKSFTGKNPVDFGGDASAEQVAKALTLNDLKRYFDVVLFVYVPTAAEKPEEMVKALRNYAGEFSLPVITYFDGEGSREVTRKVSGLLPAVTSARNAAKAVSALVNRGKYLSMIHA